MGDSASSPSLLTAGVIIIGAGFAGIGMAIRLKQEGIEDFIILERGDEIGGTWRDNTYPGAACDVPSHVYCYSFEPKSNWSRNFAGAGEIHGYLMGLVDKWGLRAHLCLDTSICEAEYSDARGSWDLVTERGEVLSCRLVVSGVGGLVNPALPNIPGLDSFGGTAFHTARWRHDVNLSSKRVAIIGTGASAVQVVPRIAGRVEKLSVFQRTACWVLPKPNGAYSTARQGIYARFPRLLRASRLTKYALSELMGSFVILDSKRLSGLPQRMSMAHLEAQVNSPATREALTPNYQFGCKRVLVSDDYWSAFNGEKVDLVTDAIERVEPTGIVTRDGTVHEFDVIVFATGFAITLASAPFSIKGRHGRELDDAWADGASAYKGVSVAGFPNWFMMMGPNTGPGHTSVLVYTEAQIAHTLTAIKMVLGGAVRSIEVRADVQARYNEGLQRRMPYTAWSSGCGSWYLSQDGSNRTLFPGLAGEYVLRTRRLDKADYFIEPV